jgi:hypothetical protein
LNTRPPWSIEDPLHIRLGGSVVLVSGLAELKMKKSAETVGLYANIFPEYLEEKLGLKPVSKQKEDIRERSPRD